MALSTRTKRIMKVGLADNQAAIELAALVNSGSAVSAVVAAIPASTNIPAATNGGASALNSTFSDTEVETALDLKASVVTVNASIAGIESRLDALEAKVNAILVSIKASGQMASS